MDSTRFVRVGGALLAVSLLLSLLLLTVDPGAPSPWRVLLYTVLGWLVQASLVLGAVMLVAGLVLRQLGLLPRVDPAAPAPVDHYA